MSDMTHQIPLIVDDLWRILRYRHGNALAKDEAVRYLAEQLAQHAEPETPTPWKPMTITPDEAGDYLVARNTEKSKSLNFFTTAIATFHMKMGWESNAKGALCWMPIPEPPVSQPSSQAGEPERCPTCQSDDKVKRYVLFHPTEDAMCYDAWHSSSQAQAGTPPISLSEAVYRTGGLSGPSQHALGVRLGHVRPHEPVEPKMTTDEADDVEAQAGTAGTPTELADETYMCLQLQEQVSQLMPLAQRCAAAENALKEARSEGAEAMRERFKDVLREEAKHSAYAAELLGVIGSLEMSKRDGR